MRTPTSALIAILSLVLPTTVAGQVKPPVPTTQPPGQSPREPIPPATASERAGKRFEPYVALASGFDTNLDHDGAGTDSVGGILAGGFFFRNNPSDPTFQLNGEVAAHQWMHSSRWDRFSQKVTASFDRDLPGRWSFDTTGELSRKGSSEDREISDQYVVIPRVAYRLTSQNRLRAYVGLRARRYDEDPDRNAFNRYVGIEFTERAAPDRRMELDVRYEVNEAQSQRQHYNRWTFGIGYALPVGADRIEAEVRYRMQHYPFREVEVDDQDVNRRDHRWIPKVSWTHPISPVLDLRAAYVFETRTSNDLDREFSAHLFSVTVVRRW